MALRLFLLAAALHPPAAGADGPPTPLVQNVTHACQNQRRALSELASLLDRAADAERLQWATLSLFGAHPEQLRAGPSKLKLSDACMVPVNRIVDLAKTGNTRPIKQLACSMGLHAGDTGDYYTCDQMSYPAADGSDAGLQYWQISLHPHQPHHGGGGGGGRRQLQHHHHGSYSTHIAMCMPSECSSDDVHAAALPFLRTLQIDMVNNTQNTWYR